MTKEIFPFRLGRYFSAPRLTCAHRDCRMDLNLDSEHVDPVPCWSRHRMRTDVMQSAVAKNGTILIGGDEPELRSDCATALTSIGYSVTFADSPHEVLAFLSQLSDDVAAALLVSTAEGDAFRSPQDVDHRAGRLPVMIVSPSCTPATLIEAMKNLATDCLVEPIAQDTLYRLLQKAAGRARTSVFDVSPVRKLPAPRAGEFVSRSRLMQRMERMVQLISASDAPCLIQGETGSGKEILARRIHQHSRRAAEPFLKINCAALPSELVESELFGYDRGAFTGAYQPKPGMFEMADGGTVLLDEIGDMDFKLQSKLLQVLQDGEYRRLGSRESAKANVRVIAATHQDLERLIEEGRFRQDLYYRINVIQFVTPPLRNRREDIVPLFGHLLGKHCTPEVCVPPMTDELEKALLAHDWPGNVRELENAARRYLALDDIPALVATLRPRPASFTHNDTRAPVNPSVPLPHGPVLGKLEIAEGQAEAEAIVRALETTYWNRRQAAVLLGIDYSALLYKIRKLRIAARRTIA